MSRAVTLITGASGGIGLALAEEFARHGHDLLLVARSSDKLERNATAITREAGVKVDWIATDLSCGESIAELLAEIDHRALSVDVLVNNAGVLHEGDFLDLSLDQQVQLVELNVLAIIRLTHALAAAMRERGAGRILNVASTSSFNPVPSLACYAASKAFLLSFSEALALELRSHDVTVTALCPGFTETDMIAQGGRQPMHLPMVPNLKPEDVARQGYEACMSGQVVRIPGVLNHLSASVVKRAPGWLRRESIALVKRWGI